MKGEKYDRREFIKITATGVSGALLTPACMQSGGKWRFFDDAEALVVEAIMEQIIPADEDGGATEANVINYLDKQLIGFFAKFQAVYRKGIAGVQQSSQMIFSKNFELLAWEEQTAVLKALESGEAPGAIWQNESPQEFFELIRDHTMQGFYGSPRHGGNRRFTSFKMLDLDYPRIVGQNRYKIFPGEFQEGKKTSHGDK